MKWLKRLLKGIAALLILLLLAAVGFRQWCAWRLPRMRAEVNAAWKDYAGVALDDVPKRFPAVETNEAALNLEKAAAKLGICLAPKKLDEKCPRNAPTEEAVKEFEALSVKDAKGDKKSQLSEYVYQQMEKPDSTVSSPLIELDKFLTLHHADLVEVNTVLNIGDPPRWEYKPVQNDIAPPDNVLAHIQLFKLIASQGLRDISRGETADLESLLKALDHLHSNLFARPSDTRVLIGLSEWRVLAAMLRKYPHAEIGWNKNISRIDWSQENKNAVIYFQWQTTTPESVVRYETTNVNWDDNGNRTETKRKSKFPERFSRPWMQLQYLQTNLALIHDMKYMDTQDPCKSIKDNESIPGVSFPKNTWYKPDWVLSYTGVMRHSKLSWWNPHGKIIYAISFDGNEISIWHRIFRVRLENEMTQNLFLIRALKHSENSGSTPVVVGGPSICKNEKWTYSVKPLGSATLTFSGKPDWGTSKDPKVPLQWTEPAPGK